MTILQSFILGIIQGLTEFLPISSSGHLIFVPHIFGWSDQGLTFDVIVHMGSLVAVVWYFRKKIIRIVRSFFLSNISHISDSIKEDRTFGMLIVLSVIPALFIGFVTSEVIKIEIRSTLVVALGLIGWGVVLGIADRVNGSKMIQEPKNITWNDALFIGFAQAIALIPGTSRSGITMTAGLFSGLTKKQAAEFSFLMSIPVIAIAGVLKVAEFLKASGEIIVFVPLIVGFFSAAISGYLAILVLMKIIEKWSFIPFVVYRIIIGIFILVYFV